MTDPGPILVIKLGALGDFVQALGPCAAIRAHHRDARIVLLTTKPYVELAEASGLFDEVWVDIRPKWYQVGRVRDLKRRLSGGGFGRVYDLQTSDRSSSYYRLMDPRPEWSGIARDGSHPHANPRRDFMHTIERQAEQLRMAGIEGVPFPDLSWAEADVARFGLPDRYALLVPGGAPHRPAKRWPEDRYGAVAARLAERGITPVLLGTDKEAAVLGAVAAACPAAVNLCGRTGFLDLAVLGRGAALAVGNDTGPMHVMAVAGCPSLVLYSHDSDPALCAQRGRRVEILRRESLAGLGVEEVWAAAEGLAVSGQ